jgi:nickel-dependent lactate racemase
MPDFSLPYGTQHLTFTLPSIFQIDEISPGENLPLENPAQAIADALKQPLAKQKLSTSSNTKTVGIAINDKTRPVSKPNPIDYLLDHLRSLGFSQENITLYVGSGTHTPIQEAELPLILSQEIIKNFRVVVHDCDRSPMADLGKTAHFTPIQINADYLHNDLKITVGNIEPHHFMGFSGGVKTAAIGLASRETINKNHAMLPHPQAKTGVYHINPMRQDIEEIGKKAGIDFSLGTILDEHKAILRVFFGEPVAVMNAAIPVIRDIFGATVSKPYDLVIASPGGMPKDINLYQAQKGLTHAARITRKNGWVILLAACPEGSGSPSFEEYAAKAESYQTIIQDFQEGYFRVGPHKAYQIARDAVRVNIILVSDIPPTLVKQWKLTPSTPDLLQPLINWISARLPADARVAVMPASTRTMTELINGIK